MDLQTIEALATRCSHNPRGKLIEWITPDGDYRHEEVSNDAAVPHFKIVTRPGVKAYFTPQGGHTIEYDE